MEDYPSAVPSDTRVNEEMFVETLAALPEKPRNRGRKDTSYGLVLKHYKILKQAKGKGYSYADLAELFESQLGRGITPGTLRKYMNRAAKEEGGAVDASVDPIPLPQKLAPVPKPLKKPSAEEERRGPPRPTLLTNDHRAQVSEDEFENL